MSFNSKFLYTFATETVRFRPHGKMTMQEHVFIPATFLRRGHRQNTRLNKIVVNKKQT